MEQIIRACKYCGKKMIIIKSNKRLFCSNRCRNAFYYHNNKAYHDRALNTCRNYYHRHKDDPEFKAKNYARVKRWIEKNRAHFNELCRKNYQKRKEKENENKTE